MEETIGMIMMPTTMEAERALNVSMTGKTVSRAGVMYTSAKKP